MDPLTGLQILSLATNIPGPAAAARLADLGATVVKIEPPAGDQLAAAAPGWYAALHRKVAIRQLDLKSSGGQTELAPLLAAADLLLTATRPAALERLGLSWAALAERYPRLCQVAIVGYRPPEEELPGHDLTYQAGLGLVDPPHLPRTVLADLAGAARAVEAALALLLARERAERPGGALPAAARYMPVALADAAADFAAPLRHGLTAPGGMLGGGLPGYNLYPAQDGWVAVAALEPHFLQRLGAALGLPAVTGEALADALSHRPAVEWERWAAERDLPLAAVRWEEGMSKK
jgi:crotonobetainyl-CoA:carnitine CoA-transferase CaiB-like acyl-CoA transferase